MESQKRGGSMDYYDTVASQPETLRRSAQHARSALSSADLDPWRSGVVVVVGMGASTHAGHALVDRLRRHGRPAFNLDASTVMELAGRTPLADSYVIVSEGGRSRETVEAVRSLPAGARLGLTNTPASPFGEAVDLVLGLGHGQDSRVYTIGYTATLQAFSLLSTALDGEDDGGDVDALPGEVEFALTAFGAKAGEVAARLADLDSLDFVGRGASLASAAEGALLFREATRTATAAFETFQYLHGPMEGLNERRGCVVIGSDRELALASFLAEQGIFTVLLTNEDLEEKENLAVVRIADQAPLLRAVLEIVPLQLVAGELARRRGLGVDGFVFTQQDTKIPA
jgi:glutamine---fructose-6-phosphate transaminase (isomerizing)